jgi:hypothetical protein
VQRDVADQRGVVRDVVSLADEFYGAAADGVEGHAVIIMQ